MFKQKRARTGGCLCLAKERATLEVEGVHLKVTLGDQAGIKDWPKKHTTLHQKQNNTGTPSADSAVTCRNPAKERPERTNFQQPHSGRSLSCFSDGFSMFESVGCLNGRSDGSVNGRLVPRPPRQLLWEDGRQHSSCCDQS